MADPSTGSGQTSGPGGNGAQTPPVGAAATAAPLPGGNGADGGGQAAPSPTFRPEGLPDRLYGNSERETIEKLYGEWKDIRKQAGLRGEVPDKAENYRVDWSDTIKPYAAGWENSEFDRQFLSKVRSSAHKHGLGEKQLAGVLNDVLGEMIAGEMVEPPLDIAKERAALIPEYAKGWSSQEQRGAVDKRMADNMAWLEAMVKRDKGLPEGAKNFVLAELGDRAWGHVALEWFRSQISGEGEFRPTAGGDGAAREGQRQRLIQRQTDERADIMNPKYDPRFVAETMDLYKEAERQGILEEDRSR